MKKIIIAITALMLCTSTFAQVPEYEKKAKEFAKETKDLCVKFSKGKNTLHEVGKLGEKIAEYSTTVNNQQECKSFYLKYNEYIRIYFEQAFGEVAGRKEAEAYIENFYVSALASAFFVK